MKKLNILALLIFVAGLVSVFTFDTATTRQIQARVMSLLSPFIHSSAAMEQAAEAATAPQINPAELKRENDDLQLQVKRLQIIQQKFNQSLEENAKLRQLIGFKQSAPFKMTAAKVIRRSSSTWWNSLIIDKGSLDGIGTDSPVITSLGLGGKTSTLAPHLTKVILLTDEMCRVSAKVEGTLEQGILAGERAALAVAIKGHELAGVVQFRRVSECGQRAPAQTQTAKRQAPCAVYCARCRAGAANPSLVAAGRPPVWQFAVK